MFSFKTNKQKYFTDSALVSTAEIRSFVLFFGRHENKVISFWYFLTCKGGFTSESIFNLIPSLKIMCQITVSQFFTYSWKDKWGTVLCQICLRIWPKWKYTEFKPHCKFHGISTHFFLKVTKHQHFMLHLIRAISNFILSI